MAVNDYVLRVKPTAGQSAPIDEVSGVSFTGTGTPALIDEGSEKAWAITFGTLLKKTGLSMALNGAIDGGGKTLAIRFKMVTTSSDSFMPMAGVAKSGGLLTEAFFVGQNGGNSYRGRINPSGTTIGSTSIASKPNGVIYTLVYKFVTLVAGNSDEGKLWVNTTGRVGTAPDAVSGGASAFTATFTDAYINCQGTTGAYHLLDFVLWDGEKTDAECAQLADSLRTTLDAGGGGTAPTGTVTIGTITPNSTGASVPFTYSAADQAGFEYQLNETGTIYPISASPATPTGLTSSTAYTIRVRAKNASGDGAWSASAPFTTSAASDVTAPVFTVAPAITSVTQTSGTATAQIDEPGSIFYVVVPQAESTPSGPQVIAGQNAAGGTPIDSGSAVDTTTLSDPFTGLTAGQAYKACYIARDDEPTPNVQSSVTVVNFNAAAAPVGTITLTDFAANTAVKTGAVTNITCMILADDASGVVVIKPGLAIDSGSDLTFNDPLIVPGTWYTVVPFGGTNRAVIRVQAT